MPDRTPSEGFLQAWPCLPPQAASSVGQRAPCHPVLPNVLSTQQRVIGMNLASRLCSLWLHLQRKFLAIFLIVCLFRPLTISSGSFILSFIHQAFIENLLCTRFCAGHETNTIPQGANILSGKHTQKEQRMM